MQLQGAVAVVSSSSCARPLGGNLDIRMEGSASSCLSDSNRATQGDLPFNPKLAFSTPHVIIASTTTIDIIREGNTMQGEISKCQMTDT